MIIFYDRITGEIVGSINGKKHYKEEANFWIGDKIRTERMIYDISAPHFDEAHKDPLFSRKFKVNLETLFLEPHLRV